MLHDILQKIGIYSAKRRYMPMGIDWLWDVQRLQGSSLACILDVGANEGQTALSLRQSFPDARIHSFEPVAATFGSLVRNVGNFANISCHQVALGSTRGMSTMTVGENSLINRVVPDPTSIRDSAGLESVQMETVDAFCLEHGIGHVDILKIDVEGAEIAVIEGATQMLRECKIDFAFVEIGFGAADSGHSYAPDVIRVLNDNGMGLYAIYDYCRLIPPDYVREGRLPVFANALFVRE
jgi:FkbM family methyltransferase